MVYLLYALFFVSCIVLIASVLLQPGKTDAGALFTSNVSSTAFQPRGSQTILSKLTIGAATTFMLSALLLAMPALTGNVSVLQTNADTETETSIDANTNANTSGATNSSTDAGSGTTINANIELNSNTAVVFPNNSNSTIILPSDSNSSTNARSPIVEPKPAENAPANK